MTRPHASFEIFEEIGRGEDTIVYRAHDLHLGRDVAIKELKEAVAADPRRREQFLSQAKFLAQFDHPAILRIHSVEPERNWIVMDLMKGSLAAQISHAPLPAETVRSILRQLTPALESLHARGKVHGSIRPSNILIDEDGRVKLSDFEESNHDGELRAPSETKKYLAPELILNEFGEVGPATDLYCLAFTALELLTGPKFTSLLLNDTATIDADVAWLRWHSSSEAYPPTQKILKSIPRDLAQTLDQLLSKKVDERIQDATQIQVLLDEQAVVPVSAIATAAVGIEAVNNSQDMLPSSVREVEPLQPVPFRAKGERNSASSKSKGASVANLKATSTPKDRLNEFLGKPYVLYPLCTLLLVGALAIGFALQGSNDKQQVALQTDSTLPRPEKVVAESSQETNSSGPEDEVNGDSELLPDNDPLMDHAMPGDSTTAQGSLPAETPTEAVVSSEMEPELLEPTLESESESSEEVELAATQPSTTSESGLEDTAEKDTETPDEVVETLVEKSVEEPVAELVEVDSTPIPLELPKLEFVSTKVNIDDLMEEFKGAPELVIDAGGFLAGVSDLAISPDGKFLAAAGGKVVRIWELDTGRLLDTLRGDRDRTSYGDCESVEFSSDGKHLAVGVNDYAAHGAIRIYRMDELSEIEALLPGHTAPVRKLSFSPDGRWMVSADSDGHIAIWDWPQRTILKKVQALSSNQPIFDELHFAGNEPVLAGIDFNGPLLIAAPELRRLTANDALPTRLHAWIMDILTDKLEYPFATENDPRKMDLRMDFEQFAAAGVGRDDNKNRFWVGLWKARTVNGPLEPRPTVVYSQHKWRVTAIDLAPEHQLVASADKFGEVHVWNATNGQSIYRFAAEGKPVYESAFEKGSKRIQFGNTPYAPDIWDRNNHGAADQVIDLEKRAIYPLQRTDSASSIQERTNRDGITIRAARNASDANMRIEKLVNGRLVSQYDFTTGRNPTIFSILDANELNIPTPVVVGDNMGLLGVWDSDRDELKRAFIGHGGLISSVSRSENGNMLLSSSADRTLRIWSLDEPKSTGIFDFKFENSAVTMILPGSSSEQAGVKVGDRILTIDGKSLTEMYREMLAGEFDYKPGDSVVVAMQSGERKFEYEMRMAEGYDFAEPILSVFIGDNQQWVIWTPQGYYDASPGAEDLIGWHINRGPSKSAKYFDVQHFRQKLYRPDIIDRILGGQSPRLAIAEANEVFDEVDVDFRSPSDLAREYPPEIEFISPKRGENLSVAQTQLEARVISRNGLPIKDVTVLVNGVAVEVIESTSSSAQELKIDLSLELTNGRNDIELVATNSAKSSSMLATYINTEISVDNPNNQLGNLNVLAIGISDYAKPGADFRELPLAASDAKLFAQSAKSQASGKLYKDVQSRVLANQEATREAILDGMQWLVDNTQSGDTIAIFIAAHAFVDSSSNFYVGAHDVEIDRPRATALAWSELTRTLHEDLPQCRKLLFLDLQPTQQAVAPGMRNPLLDLASPEMATVFFSTNSLQQVELPRPAGDRGFLTAALLATLQDSSADVQPTPPDSLLNATEFSVAWTKTVKELSANQFYPVSFAPESSQQLNLLELVR